MNNTNNPLGSLLQLHFFDLGGGAPSILQAYWSPQSSSPQRDSTNLQLKLRLPMLLLTSLCTRQAHFCRARPDVTAGGSFLLEKALKLNAGKQDFCSPGFVSFALFCCRATSDKAMGYLLHNFTKMVCTLCARIHPCEYVHLHTGESLSSYCVKNNRVAAQCEQSVLVYTHGALPGFSRLSAVAW